VIGSRVGNIGEIVNDGINGRLIAAGDVDAWKTALVDVASNPATTIDVWRRALTDPRTMDDIARDYLDLYAVPPPGANHGRNVRAFVDLSADAQERRCARGRRS